MTASFEDQMTGRWIPITGSTVEVARRLTALDWEGSLVVDTAGRPVLIPPVVQPDGTVVMFVKIVDTRKET